MKDIKKIIAAAYKIAKGYTAKEKTIKIKKNEKGEKIGEEEIRKTVHVKPDINMITFLLVNHCGDIYQKNPHEYLLKNKLIEAKLEEMKDDTTEEI